MLPLEQGVAARTASPSQSQGPERQAQVLRAACNRALVARSVPSSAQPISVPLRTLVRAMHMLAVSQVKGVCRVEKHATLEFDRDRKSMSAICSRKGGKRGGNVLFVKGAAECVLSRCTQVRPLLACAHMITHLWELGVAF